MCIWDVKVIKLMSFVGLYPEDLKNELKISPYCTTLFDTSPGSVFIDCLFYRSKGIKTTSLENLRYNPTRCAIGNNENIYSIHGDSTTKHLVKIEK